MDSLNVIAGSYTYGRYNFGQGVGIAVNKNRGQILIEDVYRLDGDITSGDCMEISLAAARRIKRDCPSLFVALAKGGDGRFSGSPLRLDHVFVLVNDKPITHLEHIVHAPIDLVNSIKNNPLLVDPSYHIVQPFMSTGYSLDFIIPGGIRAAEGSPHTCMTSDHHIPLAMIPGDPSRMLLLSVSFDVPDIIHFTVSDGRKYRIYSKDDHKLDKILRPFPAILEQVCYLRCIPMRESREDLLELEIRARRVIF